MRTKRLKYRNKNVTYLQNELLQILSLSSSAFIRRRINRSLTFLKQIASIIDSYESDFGSWRFKNLCLARTVQNEKERCQKLSQEKIEIQSAYHDILREKVLIKKELYELEQTVLSDASSIQKSLSKLVEFTNDYSTLTVRFNSLQKRILNKRENDSLPKTFPGNISFGSNNNQPVSTVNPMIKGCVIQKPTINVRRLPFSDDQRASLFQFMNVSSPIAEESEQNVSSSSGEMHRSNSRRLLNITDRRERRRAIEPPTREEISFGNDRPENEDVTVRMEPVVRLEDVTRLLQNSSIRISETDNTKSGSQESISSRNINAIYLPEVLLHRISTSQRSSFSNPENALEGCSWMFEKSSTSPYNSARKSSTSRNTSNNWNTSPCSQPAHDLEINSSKEIIENLNSSHSQSFRVKNPNAGNIRKNCSESPIKAQWRTKTNASFRSSSADNEWSCSNLSASTPEPNEESVDSTNNFVVRRRLKKSEGRKMSKRFSEVNLEFSESNEKLKPRRSSRPKKLIRLSPESDSSNTESFTPRRQRKRKSISAKLTETIMNQTEVQTNQETTISKTAKHSKKSSCTNVANISSDAERTLSGRPMRSVRARANISYEEPSLIKKLRR